MSICRGLLRSKGAYKAADDPMSTNYITIISDAVQDIS